LSAVRADVTQPEAAEALIKAALDAYGKDRHPRQHAQGGNATHVARQGWPDHQQRQAVV